MTNKFKISATVPTSYQIRSIRYFGGEVKSHMNGSYSFEMFFETKEEAIKYLVNRAEMYYDSCDEELNKHIDYIHKYDQLSIDACTARIDEVEEIEDEMILTK